MPPGLAYDGRMLSSSLPGTGVLSALRLRLRVLGQVLHLTALLLVLALSPSTYRRPWRLPLATQVVRATWPLLPGFAVVAAVLSLVVIRIVLVTAQSYGLSQYALQMVVRVLVLELIPLGAALAVALRVSLPLAAELARLRLQGDLDDTRRQGHDVLRGVVAPRALAGLFGVLLLAAVASALALVLAYLLAHGFTPWALARYVRLVGQVFDPVVSLVFVLKTGALALAVSALPLGLALHGRPHTRGAQAELELQGLTWMLLLVLLVEVAALAGNYL